MVALLLLLGIEKIDFNYEKIWAIRKL